MFAYKILFVMCLAYHIAIINKENHVTSCIYRIYFTYMLYTSYVAQGKGKDVGWTLWTLFSTAGIRFEQVHATCFLRNLVASQPPTYICMRWAHKKVLLPYIHTSLPCVQCTGSVEQTHGTMPSRTCFMCVRPGNHTVVRTWWFIWAATLARRVPILMLHAFRYAELRFSLVIFMNSR